MTSLLRWLLAAVALPSAALAQPLGPAAPVYREIGDWMVGCDNLRSCVAKALPDDLGPNGGQAGYLRLRRAGGGGAPLTVWIGAETAFTPKVSLDGKPTAGAWTAGKSEEDADGFVLQGDAAVAFMRAIRNGSSLRLATGKDAPTVSLKGLTAILLAMDEAQGRIGTATSLVHPGLAAAATVPAPGAPPLLRAAPQPTPLANRQAMIAAVRRSQPAVLKRHDCESGELERSADAAEPLNRDEAIVLIGCLTGAYQGAQLAFRVPRSAPQNAKLLILPRPPLLPDAGGEDALYTEAAYDPQTATFFTAAKGRGLADCGFSLSWTYDGKEFRLSDIAYQGRCGGGAPGDWPTLYRTRVAR